MEYKFEGDDDIPPEILEMIKDAVGQHIEEQLSGKLVVMDVTCPRCGRSWKTALNSAIPGVQAAFDCVDCLKEEEEKYD